MSAPVIWILLPILIGSFTYLLLRERTVTLIGGATSLILAGIAWLVPIDEALRIGPLSLKIASSVTVLGRSFALPPSDAPLLVIIFGMCAFWFFGAEAAGVALRLVPSGLIITALLVASIAVQPFLYAALLIELAVMVAVPLFSPSNQRPGRGVIRFLIYQTLAMPFILFAGWLLAGVEASPGDLALTVQSTSMLGLGFVFLLAIFPVYTWIPQLLEESSPYAVGFLLWLLPTIASIFGMSFLDRYAWLRTAPDVLMGLRWMGLLMLIAGGLWAALQRRLERLMAYSVIAETGFILLALSLATTSSLDLFFLLMIPRGLGLVVWALALSILKKDGAPLEFASVQGIARSYPVTSVALLLSALSTAGLPLLAGFPPVFALWQGLAGESIGTAIWFLVGLLGLLTGCVRMMAVLVMQKEEAGWVSKEDWIQRGMLGIGMIGLLVLGILPQTVRPLLENLPLMFQHLGR